MKIIYRYLFQEIAVVAVATVAVLTFLLVVVNVFRDVFDMLLNTDVSLWIITKMIFLLVPFALTFTLPWGLLLAVLIVFGRMSQDHELLALKASGIGIAPLVAPAVWLALGFSLLSFWVNAYLGPQCRKQFKNISYELVNSNPLAFFTAGKPIDRFPGYRIYLGKKNGKLVEDVHLWKLDEKKQVVLSLRADSGEIRPDFDNQRLILALFNARQEQHDERHPEDVSKIQSGTRARELPIEISLQSVLQQVTVRKSLGGSTLDDLREQVLNPTERPVGGNFTPMLTEIQKRVAFSMSCFTFVLVGIPLAIQAQRRETSVGVVISLGIVIAYYFIIVLADALKKNASVYPEVIIWMPNFIFQGLGIFLLWRVNRR